MVIQKIEQGQEKDELNYMRILIVDDEADIRDSLKDILELEIDNCVIDLASNVEDAKELAKNNKPDIALLDIKIGQDNGLDLIPVLKSLYPNMSFIMMTAYRDNEYTVKAVRFGANEYLYKPIKPNDLIQTINRLLQNQKIKREKVNADRRFHTLFEQSTQWLFLLSNEGVLIDVNKTAMGFITEDKTSVIARSFCDSPWYASSLNAKDIIKSGLREVKAGNLFNAELRVVDNNQKELIFDYFMKPVFDIEQNIYQIIVECRDISERKKSEGEIKALNETLELRVKERTFELEQSMLLLKEENKERQRAEEKAYKASEAKSDFLSRMSHELRTPMNAILGFGQMLQLDLDKLDESQQASVQEIMNAGEHLLSLLNEVLDLTAIEAGQLEVSVDVINLDDVVKQCISLMQPLINTRQLKLIDNISARGYALQADSVRLKQVLLNLLSNAVKYNSVNGTITIEGEIINKQRLRISITDTGEGLSETDLTKLFTPFERLNAQFNVEGVGIGLVIAKNMVELMGGSMGVTSTVGKGSTFYIEFDLESDNAIVNEDVSDTQSLPNLDQDKVILCIDDNEANLDLIKSIFAQKSTYTLITTTDVLEGIKIAEVKRPDIILMDINMPEISGYEALVVLQKNNMTQDIPVIAVTGNATKEDIKKGLSAGFKDFITKPFRVKVLLDAIDEVLLASKSVV